MAKSKKRLAIIPAREGSKRIPKKNIRHFKGKPIIAYTIQYANTSALFDKIHVSTESEKIMSTVKEYGLNIDFLRPHHLADDHTPLIEVINFIVKNYGEKGEFYDEIWLLMPCAPLLSADILVKVANEFDSSPFPMLSVAEMPAPIEWAYIKHENNCLRLKKPEFSLTRSQDLQPAYYDAGIFAVYTHDMLNSLDKIGDAIQPYILPRHIAIDIDDESDWLLAEMIYDCMQRDVLI